MIFRGLGRFVVVLLAFVVGFASPAAAHEGHDHNSPEAIPNMLTRIQAISPEIDGVDIKVLQRGEYLELINRSDQDVVIRGYEEEPYLKVTPTGVFENTLSPSGQINGRSVEPANPAIETNAEAEPQWVQISNANFARWHDHRVHWMSTQPPPDIEQNPHKNHVVFDSWTISFDHGSTPFTVSGDLVWEASPAPLPAALAALVLAAVVVIAGLRFTRVTMIVSLVVLATSVVAHHLGARPPSINGLWDTFTQALGSSPTTWVAWLALVAALVLFAVDKRRQEAAIIAAFGALVVLFANGLSDLGAIVPYGVDRFAVPVNLGVGAGVVVVAGYILYKSSRRLGNVAGIEAQR